MHLVLFSCIAELFVLHHAIMSCIHVSRVKGITWYFSLLLLAPPWKLAGRMIGTPRGGAQAHWKHACNQYVLQYQACLPTWHYPVCLPLKSTCHLLGLSCPQLLCMMSISLTLTKVDKAFYASMKLGNGTSVTTIWTKFGQQPCKSSSIANHGANRGWGEKYHVWKLSWSMTYCMLIYTVSRKPLWHHYAMRLTCKSVMFAICSNRVWGFCTALLCKHSDSKFKYCCFCFKRVVACCFQKHCHTYVADATFCNHRYSQCLCRSCCAKSYCFVMSALAKGHAAYVADTWHQLLHSKCWVGRAHPHVQEWTEQMQRPFRECPQRPTSIQLHLSMQWCLPCFTSLPDTQSRHGCHILRSVLDQL